VPAVFLGTLAAGYGIVREVRQPLIGVCFREANVSADRVVVSAPPIETLEACIRLWEPGGPFMPQVRLCPS
jgi:hypothetical protein